MSVPGPRRPTPDCRRIPGARLTLEDGRPESAAVRVDVRYVDVEVSAASFETDDAPGDVLQFYRDALRQYGDVVECRGEVDFTGDRPVCRSGTSGEIQLVAGEQRAHRVVVVKPRDNATEFALVYVRTRM